MHGTSSDSGTVNELWRIYQQSPDFLTLKESTRNAYSELSKKLLSVMGKGRVSAIRPKDVGRYLRVERASAPVVANREVALLSNLFNLAVERGDIDVNPCKSVRRNKERPRTEAPEATDITRSPKRT